MDAATAVSSHFRFDRVGMRFETSQTTPSFLDRRLQYRMLSFVGLISVIMVTLSLMNDRQKTGSDAAQRPTAISPDSLTYEVHRETRVLKSDEVIITPIVEDNEPRGQLADSTSRNSNQADWDGEEKGLFKRRSQERTGSDRFFTRRSPRSASVDNVDDVRSRDVQPATTDSLLDEDRSNEPHHSNRPASTPSRSAPPSNAEWNASNESATGEAVEFDRDEQPPREPPTFDAQTPKKAMSFDDDEQLFSPNHPEKDPVDSPRNIGTRNDNVLFDDEPIDRRPTEAQPVNRRPVKTKPDDDFQTESPPIEQDPFALPGNSRRKNNGRQPQVPDSEPFREDFTSVHIDRRYLDLVKDNTLGIRNDEAEVFYWLVDHARHISSAALDRSGTTEVQYVNLMTEPDRYRGDPITIEGDLWRLYEIEAGPNDYGVKRMYEGWVFTGDSGNHPYRIVCTGLAKGIQPSESLRKPVRITGYFFKREGYRSNGGVHVAPTLIAHRIEINPMPNGIPLTAGVVPYMTGAIIAIALALLVTIVSFAISDERSSRNGLQKLRGNPHVSFADLQFSPPISVEESLRQLAERERESTVSGAYGPLLTRQAAREHAVQDEATSRQRQIDTERRQLQQQTEAVQHWASRQQTHQSEVAALRDTESNQPSHKQPADDELSSDRLDPARYPVTRFDVARDSELVPDLRPPAPAIQIPAPILPPPVPREVQNAQRPAMSNTPLSTNIAFSSSKLSEWESEVDRMNSRAAARSAMNANSAASAERSAAEQIERDRLTREQETRDRIAAQHAESERLRSQQLEQDRIEHERRELERLSHEHQRREQINSADVSSNHFENHGTMFTLLPSVANRLERERLERERLEREHHQRELIEQERYEQERLAYERAAATRSTSDRPDRDHRAAS